MFCRTSAGAGAPAASGCRRRRSCRSRSRPELGRFRRTDRGAGYRSCHGGTHPRLQAGKSGRFRSVDELIRVRGVGPEDT
ncbi:MAG: hypothetical protein MZV64_02705 [Ignavibacteriales bacterium]|nr:hypothetical protein [Ignavibacteriales bacterium]